MQQETWTGGDIRVRVRGDTTALVWNGKWDVHGEHAQSSSRMQFLWWTWKCHKTNNCNEL
jgi:hypothetical protein